MPQMHSSDKGDAHTRGEKRERAHEMEIDSDDFSSVSEPKRRRTESAADRCESKETKPPEKSLIDACKEGDLEVVKIWCAQNANWPAADENGSSSSSSAYLQGHERINRLGSTREAACLDERDAYDNTPLLRACEGGHLEIVKLLVEVGASLTETNRAAHAALHQASHYGHKDIVTYLLTKPGMQEAAMLEAQNNEGHTPLLDACEGGHLEIVKLLVKAGASLTAKDGRGRTVLHLASEQGRIDVVQYLLEFSDQFKAAVLDKRDTDGNTPLLQACNGGNLEVVKLLVEAGASLTETNENCRNILHRSSIKGRVHIVGYLIGLPAIRDAATLNAQDEWLDTPLLNACEGGYLEIVKLLVEAGASLTETNEVAGAALHQASFYGHKDIVTYLLTKPGMQEAAMLEAQNNEGHTPLLDACEGGHLEIAKLLVKAGASLTAKDWWGRTVLHLASEKGRIDVVQYLLGLPDQFKAAALDEQDTDGNTPLLQACESGHLKIIELLVKAGASLTETNEYNHNILHLSSIKGRAHIVEYLLDLPAMRDAAMLNAQDECSDTPLLNACEGGYLEIVKLLVEAGASLTEKNDAARAALHQASFYGHEDIVAYLLTKPGMREAAGLVAPYKMVGTPLLDACEGGALAVVKLLVEAGARLMAKDWWGCTVLHLASEQGRIDVVKYLLEFPDLRKAAALDEQDTDGNTPLLQACESGHLEIIELLVEARASLTKMNKDGRNILHLSSIKGHAHIVEYLLDLPAMRDAAMLDALENGGNTPFLLACEDGSLKVVELLVSVGASLTTKNKWGSTALHRASSSGKTDLMQYLLNLSNMREPARLEAQDNEGNTPLLSACNNGNLKAVELLVKAGASPTAKNKSGSTALHLASLAYGGTGLLTHLLRIPAMRAAARLNEMDNKSATPLLHACLCGHLEIVKLLVEAGARLDLRWTKYKPLNFSNTATPEGVPPAPPRIMRFDIGVLDYAIAQKKYGVAAYLIEKDLSAALSEDIPAVHFYSPADPEGIDVLNHTALLRAPHTTPAHGLAQTQPSLGQIQWLSQLVNHQFALQPAAQGWQNWLKEQGVSAFIVNELARLTTFFPVLSQALATSGKRPSPAQQLHIVASLVTQMTENLGEQTPFSGKDFSKEVEVRLNTMFELQLDLLRQSAEAVLRAGSEAQGSTLLALGTDCVSINGTINHLALDHLLTNKMGLLGPNAARIALVFEEAVQLARQRGTMTEHLPAAFKERLQAKGTEISAPPGFTAALRMIPDEATQTHYDEIVFGQWRGICLAQGVEV